MENLNELLRERYRLIRLLGRGGMGEVYLAEDTSLTREVAVKKVTYSGSEFLLKAAQKEATVLARLRHGGLPRVLDCFNEEHTQYIVMEYIAGKDLGEMLRENGGPFPAARVAGWASALLDILEYLHGQNPPVVHRDIKPANVKLNGAGELFLLDFGLVKDTPTRVAGVSLSPSVYGYSQSYAPLEQINGDPTSIQTDVYGLCATLYHLLTNVKPADALDRATKVIERKSDSLRPAHEVNSAVPPALSRALEEGLRLNCEDRAKSVQELRRLLLPPAEQAAPAPGAGRHHRIHVDLGQGHGEEAAARGDGGALPHPPPHPRGRWKLYAALAASLVILVVGSVLGYRWWQRSLVERLAREQVADAQSIERSEGLLSNGACNKYRGIDSEAIEAVVAKELVRKLNDCTAAQSLFADAERAEKKDGLYNSAADAYRKVMDSYPGSTYARAAEKKVGQFERVKQATMRAWKDMQEADNQMPSLDNISDLPNLREVVSKLANRYDLIGKEEVDEELAAHIRSSSAAFREFDALLKKHIKDIADFNNRASAKRVECNGTFYPQTCYDAWYQPERRKLDEGFNTALSPVVQKMKGLADADKAVGSRLADKYKAEFKDL